MKKRWPHNVCSRVINNSRRRKLGFETCESRRLLAIDFDLVEDINAIPTLLTANPSRVTMVGSTGYFVADDGQHGDELWKTDGTPAGTTMVKDIRFGTRLIEH